MPSPKIAVIGAGPAGLTLARLLQLGGIQSTVYEGEPDRHSRNQGGSLDLHAQYGQLALKEAGLQDEFEKIARRDAERMKLIDYQGNVLADENVDGNHRGAENSNRPEVDRTALRDMLLDSLEPGTVQWNRRVDHTQAISNGRYEIHFKDGTTETDIDLLVGADGAFSKVRHLVTDQEPFYSGITMVEFWASDVSTKKPWLAKHIGAGSNFMFDEGRALLCQRQSNDAVRAYAGLRVSLSWAKESGIDWDDHTATRKIVVEKYYQDCGEDIKRTILECDDYLVLRQLFMLPIGLKWETRPGVTLLGDAGHLMTPFGAVGVNGALTDALDLGKAIIANKNHIDTKDGLTRALSEYEEIMLPRAEMFAKKTDGGLQHHFRATGGQEWIPRFKKRS